MKKILLVLTTLFLMTGCSLGGRMDNTPTKQVEKYLGEYQTLSSNVLSYLDSLVNLEDTFDMDQKTTYKDLLKKHYQDLTYKVKEETVNGDKATVEVEIEVNDYTKALSTAEEYKKTNESEFLDDNKVFDDKKYNDYKLRLLKETKDRVKYTIYFTATKVNGKWTLDQLSDSDEQKILGIYEY